MTAPATITGDRRHWQRVYQRKSPDRVSWYEPVLERSLAMIESARLSPDAPIIDVGGGASSLAVHLLDAGHTDVTALDLSAVALDYARREAGEAAARIHWIEGDIRTHELTRRYDLWHDRALFHFMTAVADRERYLEALRRGLRPGGHVVLATFGPDGPQECSGLPVMRYGVGELAATLGEEFEAISSEHDDHRTPAGGIQQFLYAHFRRRRNANEGSG